MVAAIIVDMQSADQIPVLAETALWQGGIRPSTYNDN